MNFRLIYFLIISVLLLPVAETSLAASSKNEFRKHPAPISIRATNIRINQKTSNMVYTGNVKLSYKTLRMTGTRAVVVNTKLNSKHVTLTGSPGMAKFTDKMGRSTQVKSDKLSYNSQTQIVIATGHAKIVTRSGTLNAHKIEYNLDTDHFSIVGNKNSPRVSARLKAGGLNAHDNP